MSNPQNPWKVVKEEVIESYPIFSIKKSLRHHPVSNEQIEFLLVDGLNWVNVLAFTDKNELVMVKQYRHGIEDFTIELPGGCVEKHETEPQKAAMRELLEETGYSNDGNVEFLGMLRPNPAMYNMKNFFYIARGCKLIQAQELDEGEDIEIVLKPYAEVVQGIKDGTFIHGMCTAAIGMFEMKGLK